MDKYAEHIFSMPIRRMIADLCEQDKVAVDVLYFLAKYHNQQITVAVIEKNIKTKRRVGIRNAKGKIYTYKTEVTQISRAKAERVVEKLIFAGLVTATPQLPLKLLEITVRGRQVITELRERMEANTLKGTKEEVTNDN